jgi:hypothetical protein
VTTVASSDLNCTDINPEYGITGTPVIDLSTNILYVVAETLENNGASYVKKLHALDITTGGEKPGSPVVISASVTVPGQSAVTFDPQWQQQRAGLLLYKGVVYMGFGSHCDLGDWRGWILGYSYNGSSFSQPFVFSNEPSSVNGRQSGIWMSGQGLPMDTGSNLFVATGNGEFDTNVTPPINYGDSIIRIDLSQGPTVQDYFSAWNEGSLDTGDQDLGSGGIAILPDQSGPNPHLLVQAEKGGVIHVVNRDNMGHFNSSGDTNIVQEFTGVGGMYASPVYFNGKVYLWGSGDVIKAFTVTNGMLSTTATDKGSVALGFPGPTPTITANGTSNAILWALEEDGFVESGAGGPAVLYAYDANNLSAGFLYNSNQNSSRDNPGGAIKFAVPTVTNGKVYVGAEGQLSVYGELGPALPQVATPQIKPGSETFTGSVTISITDATSGAAIYYTTDGSTPPSSPTTQTYSAPFSVSATTVVNAIATETGYTSSLLASSTYTLQSSPSITNLSTTSGAVGTAVTITGSNLGSSGTVTFNGTPATTTSWTSTSIATSVPTGATTGNVVVKVGGVASNGVNFTVTSSGLSNMFTLVQQVYLTCPKSPCNLKVTSTGSNHLLVVSAYADQTNQSFLTAVSGAGTWTLPTGCQSFNTTTGSTSCGYNLSSAPGATTITLTLQNSNSYQVVFWEYSFTTSSSSLDTSGTALTKGNGTTISGVGLNLTGSNDVIIQWSGCVPTGVASPYGHLIGNSEVKFADNENSTNVAATNMWFTTWTATSCEQAAAAFK